MENKRISKKNHTNNNPNTMINPRRRRRRRSHSRKTLSNCLINFAEARREVAKALRRHRSATATNTQYGSHLIRRAGLSNYPIIDHKVMGSFSYSSSSPSFPISPQDDCHYPLVEAHVAGPTWSTTGPSVVSGPNSILEALGFDEYDESSFAASYSWWVGFLETLDGKKNNEQEEECEKPNLDDDGLEVLGQAHNCKFDTKEEMLVCDVLNIS